MKVRYTANIGGAFGSHNAGDEAEGSREDFKILLEKGFVVEIRDGKDEGKVQPASVPPVDGGPSERGSSSK